MSTTGPKIDKGIGSLMREALADDPIYTRGFTIGGLITKASFPATAGKVVPTPNEPSQTPDASKKKPAAKYSKHSFPPTVAKDLPPWWNKPSPADDHLELGEVPNEPSQAPGASKKKPAAKRTPRT